MHRLFTPSPYRNLFWATIAGILFFGSLSIVSIHIDAELNKNRAGIEAALNKAFHTSTEIGRIRYNLFYGVTIDGFRLKESPGGAVRSPVEADEIVIHPSLSLFPRPVVTLGRVILVRPHFSLQAGFKDILKMGQFLSGPSIAAKEFGFLRFESRLSSLDIREGRITLLSADPANPWKQEFEGVDASLGRRWFIGERLRLKGHILGDPKASFQIRGNVTPSPVSPAKGGPIASQSQETGDGVKNPSTNTDLRFDFDRFATAYLKPHLAGRLDLPEEALTAEIQVRIKNGKEFVSKGRIVPPKPFEDKNLMALLLRLATPRLSYEVQGAIQDELWKIVKLSLRSGSVELTGSGVLGFSEKTTTRVKLSSAKIRTKKLKKIFPEVEDGELRLFVTLLGSSNKVLPVLDVVLENISFFDPVNHIRWSKAGGRFRLVRNRVFIHRLQAFMDNLPVRLRGEVRRFDRPRLFLELMTYPDQVPELKPQNPINVTLRTLGEYDGSRWNLALWIKNTVYRDNIARDRTLDIRFRKLKFEGPPTSIFPEDILKGTRFESELFSLSMPDAQPPKRLSVGNASFFISGDAENLKLDLRQGAFCGGRLSLDGRGHFTSLSQASWEAEIRLLNADARIFLSEIGEVFPLSGRFSAAGTLRGEKDSTALDGSFNVRNGVIGPIRSLEKLADETGIEPLRRLEFKELASRFHITEEGFELKDLKLSSDQAMLFADVKAASSLMSGKISAKFPEHAIQDSSKLKWLMRFVGSGDWLDFDFKVAGHLKEPRIQWLPGEFKKKIESRLAPWLRDILAHELEKRMAQ